MSRSPRLLFFDLDDTLYPSDNGLWEAISSRIDLFLLERLQLGPAAARESRARYANDFGTTLAGLMSEHDLDPKSYLDFVHDIDLTRFINPDPGLTELLSSIPARKFILTNASRAHAERVLRRLRVEEMFEGIIAIEDMGFVNKPEVTAYQRALSIAAEPSPDRCLILDDRLRNLIPAAAMGMRTVLVGSQDGAGSFNPDFVVNSIHDLLTVMPELAQDKPFDHVRD